MEMRMMSKSKVRLFYIPVFLLVLIAETAIGAEGISAGPLRIKPSVEVKAGSDSNVFLAPENEEQSDTFFSIFPRVGIDFPFQQHLFTLNYGVEMRRYSEYDTENVDLQDLDFQGLLNVNSQLNIRLLERYKELAGDADEMLGRIEYSRNNAAISAAYEMNSKLSFEGQYGQTKYDYKDEALIGRTDNQASVTAVYNLYEKWGILGEVAHGEVDIENTEDDASYNRFLVGARGNFTPKLSGTVKLGQEMRSYEGDREDADIGFITAEVTHQVANDMLLTLGANQQLVESIVYAGNAYTETQWRARLTKTFIDRVHFFLSGYYQSNEYENAILRGETPEKRSDDIWQAEIGVEYKLNKWASLLAGLEHKVFDSNFDENDFEVDRFNIGARLEY
jgi:polysaccharide biosynthesis protein VpsM